MGMTTKRLPERGGDDMSRLSCAIQILSALFAVAAAIFWFKASIDATPNQVASAMKSQGGMDVFGSDLTRVVDALIHQGQLNAYAAGCAGFAALLQAFGIFARG
jgi:hypothetical protein